VMPLLVRVRRLIITSCPHDMPLMWKSPVLR
jgi:hypothetical protein